MGRDLEKAVQSGLEREAIGSEAFIEGTRKLEALLLEHQELQHKCDQAQANALTGDELVRDLRQQLNAVNASLQVWYASLALAFSSAYRALADILLETLWMISTIPYL
jgi:hypothetical protein